MKHEHFRWVVVALLFFITAINYIDRAAISYAIDDIASDFDLTNEQVGLVLGAFGMGYWFTTFLGGIAVDRYGARTILTIAAVAWSLSMGLMGIVSGFFMLYTLRVLLGLGEGPNFPALTRSVADWLPPKERAVALSNALVAVPIALAVGGPIVSELLFYFSWKLTFVLMSGAVVLWIPVWWILFRDTPEQSRFVSPEELKVITSSEDDEEKKHPDNEQEDMSPRQVWRFLLLNRTLLANNWAFFVFGYYLFFFMTWMPRYLHQEYDMDLQQIGWFSILPWLLAALFLWGTGYLSDYIFRKTNRLRLARSYPIWISQVLTACSVIPILVFSDIHIRMVGISLAVGFSMSANSTYYATNVDMAKSRAGTSLGIMDTLFALSGFLAPVVTGWVVSLTGHFHYAFVLLVALSLTSVVVVLLFHQPDRDQKIGA